MRIGIVNDVAMAAEALRRAIALEPRYSVTWIAKDGAEAVAMCAKDKPDLVLMDLLMPGINGVETTRQIMAGTPCPILVVTANVGANAWLVFEAMACGALDAVDTPSLVKGDLRLAAAPLLKKIDNIEKRLYPKTARRELPVDAPTIQPLRQAAPSKVTGTHAEGLVAIGSSAGGPAALSAVLKNLPKDFKAAVVVIQHVDEKFVQGMADWLGQHSALPVRLAKEGDTLEAGTVLLASTDGHLVIKNTGRVGYTDEPKESLYIPSVNAFFGSVCKYWRGNAVGVQLSGMGSDGAKGLKLMREKGFHTIAQDQATSGVYGMPKAAVALGAVIDVLPVQEIAPNLLKFFSTATKK